MSAIACSSLATPSPIALFTASELDLLRQLQQPHDLSRADLYDAVSRAQKIAQQLQEEYFELDSQISLTDSEYQRKADPNVAPSSNISDSIIERSTKDMINERLNAPSAVRLSPPLCPANVKTPASPAVTPCTPRTPRFPARSSSPSIKKPSAVTPRHSARNRRAERRLARVHWEDAHIRTPSPASDSSSPSRSARRAEVRPAKKAVQPLPLPVKKTMLRVSSSKKVRETDPKRSEAMRAAWARRQAAGTSGRYGGAPTDKLAIEKWRVKQEGKGEN